MKQNSLPEKVEIIRTGRTFINLNFAGRFSTEIVYPKGTCTTACIAIMAESYTKLLDKYVETCIYDCLPYMFEL